jgi:hypothetical protein
LLSTRGMTPDLSNRPIHDELSKCVDQARALRDEVRLQVHLAGMDADRLVDDVGKELESIAASISRAGESSRTAFFERLRKIEDKLTEIARTVPGAL